MQQLIFPFCSHFSHLAKVAEGRVSSYFIMLKAMTCLENWPVMARSIFTSSEILVETTSRPLGHRKNTDLENFLPVE